MKYAERLRQLRGDTSQESVAKAIGISVSAYVKYERGERNPRDEIKIKLAQYYHTPVADIFFSSTGHDCEK